MSDSLRALIDRVRELDAAATKPWTSMREGNQYVDHHRFGVGASRVDGLVRPWNARFVIPACEMEEVSRFKNADADFIAEARTLLPQLCDALEQRMTVTDVLQKIDAHINAWEQAPGGDRETLEKIQAELLGAALSAALGAE